MNIGTLNPICCYFSFRNLCLLSGVCLLSSLFSFDKSKARAPSHVLLLASACLVSRRPAPLKLCPTLSQAIPHLRLYRSRSYSSFTHSTSSPAPAQALPFSTSSSRSYSSLPNSTCCSTQAAPSSIIVTGMPGCPLRRNANHKF